MAKEPCIICGHPDQDKIEYFERPHVLKVSCSSCGVFYIAEEVVEGFSRMEQEEPVRYKFASFLWEKYHREKVIPFIVPDRKEVVPSD